MVIKDALIWLPALIQMKALKYLWLENALQETGLDIGIARVKNSRIYEYLGQPYWKGGCLDEFSKNTFYLNPGFRGTSVGGKVGGKVRIRTTERKHMQLIIIYSWSHNPQQCYMTLNVFSRVCKNIT